MRSVLTWCLLNLGTSLSHLHPGSGPSEALHRPPPSPHRRPPPTVAWYSGAVCSRAPSPPYPGSRRAGVPLLPSHLCSHSPNQSSRPNEIIHVK